MCNTHIEVRERKGTLKETFEQKIWSHLELEHNKSRQLLKYKVSVRVSTSSTFPGGSECKNA